MLPSANPSVIYQKLDDGAVLFAPATELYFGLNAVGAVVWDLLPPRTGSIEELCRNLETMFPEVPASTIRADVEELLERLVAEGLLLPREPSGTDAATTP